MSFSTLKCAVIGLGDMGTLHARHLRETSGLALAAVSDPAPDAAARATASFPGAVFYADYQALLARERPELVVVVTPHFLHAPITIAALEAGAHVLVEKPMANTVADCHAMITAAAKAGRTLTVYHSRRYDDWLRAASEAIERGLLGRIVQMQSAWAAGPQSVQSWRGRKHESGGLIFDLGAHLVDCLLQLDPSGVTHVSGQMHQVAGSDPSLNEAHSVADLTFASGTVGRVTVSTLDLAPAPRLRLVGETGTLVDELNWNDGACRVAHRQPDGTIAWSEVPYRKTTQDAKCRLFYDKLAAFFQGRGPLPISAESAARVIEILTVAEISALRGGVPLVL